MIEQYFVPPPFLLIFKSGRCRRFHQILTGLGFESKQENVGVKLVIIVQLKLGPSNILWQHEPWEIVLSHEFSENMNIIYIIYDMVDVEVHHLSVLPMTECSVLSIINPRT